LRLPLVNANRWRLLVAWRGRGLPHWIPPFDSRDSAWLDRLRPGLPTTCRILRAHARKTGIGEAATLVRKWLLDSRSAAIERLALLVPRSSVTHVCGIAGTRRTSVANVACGSSVRTIAVARVERCTGSLFQWHAVERCSECRLAHPIRADVELDRSGTFPLTAWDRTSRAIAQCCAQTVGASPRGAKNGLAIRIRQAVRAHERAIHANAADAAEGVLASNLAAVDRPAWSVKLTGRLP
jgi:hypothetical protein